MKYGSVPSTVRVQTLASSFKTSVIILFCPCEQIYPHPVSSSLSLYLTVAEVLSDCDSCLTLAVLAHMHLGSNATELQAASFLNTVCQLHPSAMPKVRYQSAPLNDRLLNALNL